VRAKVSNDKPRIKYITGDTGRRLSANRQEDFGHSKAVGEKSALIRLKGHERHKV